MGVSRRPPAFLLLYVRVRMFSRVDYCGRAGLQRDARALAGGGRGGAVRGDHGLVRAQSCRFAQMTAPRIHNFRKNIMYRRLFSLGRFSKVRRAVSLASSC